MIRKLIIVLFILKFITNCANEDSDVNQELINDAWACDIEGVKDALKSGADINAVNDLGGTAILEASNHGCTEVVAYLISEGADVNISDNYGATPLMFAANRGYTQIVDLLLNAGADVAPSVSGQTALTSACIKGYTKIVQLLIDAGSDVNVIDIYGRTPLSYAKEYEHTEIIKLLETAGAI